MRRGCRQYAVGRQSKAEHQTQQHSRWNDNGTQKRREFEKTVTGRHVIVDIYRRCDTDNDDTDAVSEQVETSNGPF